ncbi:MULTISPECIES: EAL domain-containing protein [unclassified Sinorhizobium]|uniref:bifunctional diguanylate cyclase/phosphodiesterase n=1 Tax=unclassified Sinorhizobium TaxID=2613772 RepID=UPI0024C2CC8A|nr:MULTISPECIES: EAL domain-containing protein [unclassified Sinorhizobium]MDK1375714.1 EAL domain-containing protein [Sinorhizobium sp. 6-70]MDK1479660.1 EAL domain-containing protein [Sinorhizobium sp. 6-117]
MKIIVALRRRIRAIANFAKPSLIPALIAGAVVFIGGNIYERQHRENFRKDLKIDVENELNLIAGRFRAEFNTNIAALNGLANGIAVQPEMKETDFSKLASKLLLQNPQLVRVSAAPAGVVTMTFSQERQQSFVGTDFGRFRAMRVALDRAALTTKPVVVGPVRLPSSRNGFEIFVPVSSNVGGRTAFWGFVEAVLDEEALYRSVRLNEERMEMREAGGRDHRHVPVHLAIRDVSVSDNVLEPFLDETGVFLNSPVLRELILPGGVWELAATPVAGWAQEPANSGEIRLATITAVVVVVVPIFLAGGLVNERQRNIAKLKAREGEVMALSHRLNLALDASKIGIWEIDIATQERSWDDRMFHLHGLVRTGRDPTHEQWRATVHPDDIAAASIALFRSLDEGLEHRSQYRVVTADGAIRHVRHVGSAHEGADGRAKITGISWDVTDDVLMTEQLRAAKATADMKNAELADAKDRIEHNSLHDPLTGLGNRRMLDKALDRLFAANAVKSEGIAILHIDLDRFKQINDTLGHAAGDAMLVHASEILRSSISPDDIVARIGGDEFVVVISGAADDRALAALCDHIIAKMRQPVDYDGFPCRFGVSIGVAVAHRSTADARKLLVNADIALYRAKESGRNRHQFFTQALEAEVVTNKRIADEILEGIERDEFVPWYQPQFDASTLALSGVEALIRWQHPREGILTPDRFLRIAEELNVTATLDRLVLEKALADRMRWASAGLHVPKISVNVSAKRLQEKDLLASLKGLSIMPGQISFELVESIFLDESDDVVTANIDGIKKLGIDIEIDDFGTGHTSIVSLLKIKPKRLKIDRQLVAPVLGARTEQALVRSIIDIGRSLGIETVAEGVETMAHAEMLGILGCDLLQGYAFSKPLSSEGFIAFAADRGFRLAS